MKFFFFRKRDDVDIHGSSLSDYTGIGSDSSAASAEISTDPGGLLA